MNRRRRTMLPQLFAVHTGRSTGFFPDLTTGRLALFQARLCDGPGGGSAHPSPWLDRGLPAESYRISAYRLHTGSGDDGDFASAFVVEGRFGHPHTGEQQVTLFNEERGPPPTASHRGGYGYGYDGYGYDDDYVGRAAAEKSIYRGPWRYSGYTLFSMYCATPIPIVVFVGVDNHADIAWPTPFYNRVTVTAGDRTIIRIWANRWNPATWTTEIEDAYEARAARRAPAPAPAAAARGGGGGGAARPPAVAPPPPKFVTDLIVADAVAKGATCSITMEPLRIDKTTVTACYHLFDTDALNAWAAAAAAEGGPATLCPQCRKTLH